MLSGMTANGTAGRRAATPLVAILVCAAATLSMTSFATAQNAAHPNRMIKIVSPAPPGGGTDIMARLIQPQIEKALGQTVIVEARGGAGGYIGSEYVARSPADGYTLLIGGAFTTITATLQKKPSYAPRTDLTPVAVVGSVPNVLVAGPRLKANSVAELVAAAKAAPGQLNVGSNGVGTSIHLSGELFKLQTGVVMQHIAYKGWADCVRGLLGGELDVMFDNVSTAIPNVLAGKSRALAVTSSTRHRSLPDVPTLEEAGVKGAEVMSWFGLMAPAATPRPIVEQIGAVLAKAAQDPEFQAQVHKQGLDVTFKGPAEAMAFWLGEIDKWEKVVKAANIELQ